MPFVESTCCKRTLESSIMFLILL